MKEESCLQSEGHSRISRVSDWRVWERVSRCEFDSGKLESLELSGLGKRIGGFLREVRKLVMVNCMGNEC